MNTLKMNSPSYFIVVDDDSTSNLICKFNITKLYPEAVVKTFGNPQKALEFVGEEQEHLLRQASLLLLTDINMPEMSGWEFLDQMQERAPRLQKLLQVYMLSSSIHDFEDKASSHPIVKGFLSKPLSLELLRQLGGN